MRACCCRPWQGAWHDPGADARCVPAGTVPAGGRSPDPGTERRAAGAGTQSDPGRPAGSLHARGPLPEGRGEDRRAGCRSTGRPRDGGPAGGCPPGPCPPAAGQYRCAAAGFRPAAAHWRRSRLGGERRARDHRSADRPVAGAARGQSSGGRGARRAGHSPAEYCRTATAASRGARAARGGGAHPRRHRQRGPRPGVAGQRGAPRSPAGYFQQVAGGVPAHQAAERRPASPQAPPGQRQPGAGYGPRVGAGRHPGPAGPGHAG
ncbi:hypothetical protein D9M68_458250 [compost metagenome]